MSLARQSSFVIEPEATVLPERERPINRLREAGAYGVSTAELLALVLRQSNLDTANRILNEFKSLPDLSHASEEQLARIPGIGPTVAASLHAALELGRRMVVETREIHGKVTNPADAAHVLIPMLAHLEHEEFVVLYLDTRNQITDREVLYKGTLNSSLVRIAEVFRGAIRRNSAAIIVAHSHPSGDPNPSPEDIALTRRLVEAGKVMETEVLDHLIIGNNRYVSLRERGLGFGEA